MNKQQLANKIWESANKMRSKIEANEYKDYILGFIFYKYLSDKEVEYMRNEGATIEDMKECLVESDDEELIKLREQIQSSIGYFISYDNLFSTWLSMGSDFDVSNVRDALSAFSRLIDENYKKVYDGIFDTLQTGLSKLGESSGKQTKAITDLLELIKDIPMDAKQDYDVLGFIYEYLISQFAANAGKKAGEFYTPHEVSMLMSEIVAEHLKDRKTIQIFDPTSGSGSLLINIGQSAAKHMDDKDHIKYYAQELKQNTYNLTRMNLVMRGIKPSNIITRNADTLEDDWPIEYDGSFEPLRVDAVVSNPPYSQQWNPTDKESDPRYSSFGLAPKGKADYAFLLHDLFHVKPDGIMTIVLPHGVLFRGGEEGTIRKNLIEKNHIDAIIGLPANIFFGTGIPTIIMVLKKNRENTDTLIIDASKGFVKEGKNNKLQASDIKRIADTVKYRLDVPKFSKKVSREEIRENDYNLNIPRYVDSSEKPESWDIYSSMFGGIPKNEIDDLDEYWKAFPTLKNDIFKEIGAEHMELTTGNIKEFIEEHNDVTAFKKHFESAFNGFDEYLETLLLNDIENVKVSRAEEHIADDIFNRLKDIPLIDKYKAYQILDNSWSLVSSDIEVIQTEGIDSIKAVDPNMVLKKKNNKDVEVQEGWNGRIIPFELAQNVMLAENKKKLDDKKNMLSEVVSEREEIIESLSEDDKTELGDVLNNDNTAFAAGPLGKYVKALLKEHKLAFYEEESLERKAINAKALMDQEKSLKAEIKKEENNIHVETKTTIENLNDDEIKVLLKEKWIMPVLKELVVLPNELISNLIKEIQSIADKYDTTFADMEKEIKETEKELAAMLNQLIGSDADMQGLEELKSLLGGE